MSAPHAALLMVAGAAAADPRLSFWAPLTTSLTPTIAGAATPTFTRASTATVHGVAPGGNAADGLVVLACASGEARFYGARRVSSGVWASTYADGSAIPAANLRGYVAEGSANNRIQWSEDFTNAAWTKDNVTVTANTTTAPDGTTTADTIADNATNNVHRVVQSPGVGGICSVYVKAGTLTWIQLWSTSWANFNIVTGVIGNFSGSGATITALGNGWYCCSISGSSGDFRICCAPSDVGAAHPSYVGTGQTMFVWGAQLSQSGGNLASYIPTTTATVTRSADDLQYAMTSNLDGALGTAYAEVFMPPIAAVDRHVLRVFASSKSALWYGADRSLRISGTGNIITANVGAVSSLSKAASAWGSGTASACLNAGTVATGAFTNYTASGNIGIGTDGATNTLYGPIRNVKIYNVRLSNAELVTLTT